MPYFVVVDRGYDGSRVTKHETREEAQEDFDLCVERGYIDGVALIEGVVIATSGTDPID